MSVLGSAQGFQRDAVYLVWPIEPLSCGVSAYEYSFTVQRSPNKLEDLTPNLTYSMFLPTSSCFMCEFIHTLHLFMISSEDSNNVNPTNGQLYTLSTGPLSASQSAAGMIKPTINESTVWRTWILLSMLKSWFYLTDMKTLLFLTCMDFIVWCWGTTMFFF
jgi:hypothetical protein